MSTRDLARAFLGMRGTTRPDLQAALGEQAEEAARRLALKEEWLEQSEKSGRYPGFERDDVKARMAELINYMNSTGQRGRDARKDFETAYRHAVSKMKESA